MACFAPGVIIIFSALVSILLSIANFLTKASNYLTSKFTNKNITQIKKVIQLDIKKSQDDLETISSKLIQKGIMETLPNTKNPYMIWRSI